MDDMPGSEQSNPAQPPLLPSAFGAEVSGARALAALPRDKRAAALAEQAEAAADLYKEELVDSADDLVDY